MSEQRSVWLYAKKSDINDATFFYIRIIERALADLGLNLVHTDAIRKIPWRTTILVVDCKRALEVRLRRPNCDFWLWLQGIVPEEAELQLKSKTKKLYWTIFERLSIPKAKRIFMVSKAMSQHYSDKYGFQDLPAFIMPCVNQKIEPELFRTPGKYSSPSFVYAGSLHRWQCIDAVLDSFSLIREKYPAASLTLYTGDQHSASRMISTRGLSGVRVDYCPPSDLSKALAAYKYGFILREPHCVNAVATPTKVSSYMAAGVIPVMTTAVDDYVERLASVSPVIMLNSTDPNEILSEVCRLESRVIKEEDVLASYSKIFYEYFDLNLYIPTLVDFLRSAIG